MLLQVVDVSGLRAFLVMADCKSRKFFSIFDKASETLGKKIFDKLGILGVRCSKELDAIIVLVAKFTDNSANVLIYHDCDTG